MRLHGHELCLPIRHEQDRPELTTFANHSLAGNKQEKATNNPMKNLLLSLLAACLLMSSCSKPKENPTRLPSTSREVQTHTASIAEANQWIVAYNNAHPSDTTNKTFYFETTFMNLHPENPNIAFYTGRLGLYEGYITIIFFGWDAAGLHVLSVDQHIRLACATCKCCDDVAQNMDGTIPQ